MNEVTLLIGGKSIHAQDERTFDRIDPMKRNVATRSAAASVPTLILPSNPQQRHLSHGQPLARDDAGNSSCGPLTYCSRISLISFNG